MALTKDRMTPSRDGKLLVLPMADDAVIKTGALVMVEAGYATCGGISATAMAAGRANEAADNTNGGAGDKSITVERGVFKYKNSATDPVEAADLLKDCYIEDDETVAQTSATSTLSKAGKVLGVESDGVWVEIQ